MNDRTWAAVPFRNTWDREVRQRALSWAQLVEVFTTFQTSPDGTKKQIPAWSPAIYKEGTTRGKANVEGLSCLVLDYDEGKITIPEAIAAWRWRAGILHTSWSHTEEHHKFRVILPLDEPVSVEDWPGVFAWAARYTRQCTNPEEVERLEDIATTAKWTHTIDLQCKDPGRIYYVPAVQGEDSPRYAEAWEADVLAQEDGPGPFLGVYEPWGRHVKAYRAQRAERERPPAPPVRIAKASVRHKEKARRLRTDPGTRERLGPYLGGRIVGDAVRGVLCPRCGRSTVWWLIDPDTKASASCNHSNSCGWYGSLVELAASGGVGV